MINNTDNTDNTDNITNNTDNITNNTDNTDITDNTDNTVEIIINIDTQNNNLNFSELNEDELDQYNEVNLNLQHVDLNSSNQINIMVDDRITEIMNYVYENMMNIDDDIIKFIDYCYLKNLQYDDDEILETIRYTIRTIFHEGTRFDIKYFFIFND